MKKISLFLIVLTVMTISSCTKATYIKTDHPTLAIPLAGINDSTVLHSDGTSFDITHTPQWATVALHDSTLTYSIPSNNTGKVRHDSIVISADDKSLVIPVTQYTRCTHINISQADLTFGKAGGKEVLKIDTDGLLTVSLDNDKAGIKASYADGLLTVTAQPNSGDRQICIISLNADDQFKELVCTIAGDVCPRCNGTGTIKCPYCNGTGLVAGGTGQLDACPTCGGISYQESDGKSGSGTITCPDCHGSGR